MKRLWILAFVAIAGCSSTIPVVKRFPAPPTDLTYPAALDTLQPGAKLSDLLDCVNRNNSKYHEASSRLRAWVDWYSAQKGLK